MESDEVSQQFGPGLSALFPSGSWALRVVAHLRRGHNEYNALWIWKLRILQLGIIYNCFMKFHRFLSPENIAYIRLLRGQGMSFRKIAARCKVSRSSVHTPDKFIVHKALLFSSEKDTPSDQFRLKKKPW